MVVQTGRLRRPRNKASLDAGTRAGWLPQGVSLLCCGPPAGSTDLPRRTGTIVRSQASPPPFMANTVSSLTNVHAEAGSLGCEGTTNA